ncbi:hypothetical protein M6B22_09480 [Jatrophihabitans cynanchi]|jgi:hypothetical protein|uniref:Uncharacterized protein n=1 Tax=Jatrophihabitans cynanchi TaxID=2944128 RepID=A0ABY7K456_9ACTN|nr:hypothetical protein [Jatrophihabitans sp. SB3-54]WAX58970.1 hypothetical protein M6B22_09480 [Jatrophihabitans sp. SB3-54]
MRATALRVTPREYLLVVERLLQHAGLDRGVVVPLRDSVLDAELATGAALRYMIDAAGRIAACAPNRLTGDGVPALLVAPSVLDEARRLGTVTITGLDAPQLLAGLRISGVRHGLEVQVRIEDVAARVSVLGPAPVPASSAERLAGGPERLGAVTAGIVVDAELWWAAYRRSNLALSVDTRTSRRHAGATLVAEDGTLLGATDDEFDPTIYSGDREALFDESKEQT